MIEGNFDEIAEWMESYGDDSNRKLRAALFTSGILVKNEAVISFRSSNDESISGLPPRNQTGVLSKSITTDQDEEEDGPVQYVGTPEEYSVYQEFGTSRIYPHPFLGPALDRQAPTIEGLLENALK
jgi:HK97 gp10 family phage protein